MQQIIIGNWQSSNVGWDYQLCAILAKPSWGNNPKHKHTLFSRVLLDSIEVLTIFSTVPFDEDCFCESHALWFWSGHGCIHGQTRSTKPG